MKLAVVGSREFSDYDMMKLFLDSYKEHNSSLILVSGGAPRGADNLAERYAREHNLEIILFFPDWQKFGKAAGMIRNTDIIQEADEVIAFWDGVSSGTHDSIKKAHKMSKPTLEIKYKELQ
jgi:hypothetical protein